MATSEKILKLDVSTEQEFIYLKCKQYDNNSRIYKLVITDRHIPIPLNGDELITVHIEFSNGKFVDDVCPWKNGYPYLTMTDSMLAVRGDAKMEVGIFNSKGEILKTMTNYINIQRSMIPYDRMVASDEFNVLNHLIQSVLNVGENAEAIEQLLKDLQAKADEVEKEFDELSDEARELIEDLKEVLVKAEGLEEKLDLIDEGVKKIEDTSNLVDESNEKAQEALNTANSAIEKIDNLDGVILSETQPTNQSLTGLWLVVENNVVTKAGKKVAENGDENDYEFTPFGGSSNEVPDGVTYIDFSGEIVDIEPDNAWTDEDIESEVDKILNGTTE